MACEGPFTEGSDAARLEAELNKTRDKLRLLTTALEDLRLALIDKAYREATLADDKPSEQRSRRETE